jgi:hypothetical protein
MAYLASKAEPNLKPMSYIDWSRWFALNEYNSYSPLDVTGQLGLHGINGGFHPINT